jgi:hypothetical protein
VRLLLNSFLKIEDRRIDFKKISNIIRYYIGKR